VLGVVGLLPQHLLKQPSKAASKALHAACKGMPHTGSAKPVRAQQKAYAQDWASLIK